jgi:hypothetical protein
MNTKVCIKCGIEKELDEFYDAKGKNIKKPKKINTCKQCAHRITKENTAKHYDERKGEHFDYLSKHPTKTKVCRLCRKELPLAKFVFHATRADYMSSECRVCRLAQASIRLAQKKEQSGCKVMPDSKTCKVCGLVKPIDNFNTHYGNKDLHRHECRDCQKVNQQKHYPLVRDAMNAKNREKRHDPVEQLKRHHQHVKRKFGISRDGYEKMLLSQNGKCAICGTENPSRNGKAVKNFAVDHNHTTGQVRSLLCTPCNQGIGHFLDSPNLLRTAATYLETFNQYPIGGAAPA